MSKTPKASTVSRWFYTTRNVKTASFALLASLLLPLTAANALPAEKTIHLRHEAYDGTEERDAVATTVAISADGKHIAAGGDDHRLRIWDAQTGDPVERLAGHHKGWIRGIQFSADGNQIASVGADQHLRLFSLDALSSSQATQLMPETDGSLLAVAFHPTEPLIATVGFDTPVRIYDLTTNKQVKELASPSADVRTVQFSSDGRWLAAAGRNGTVRVWDQLGKSSFQDLPSDGRRIRTLAFSPDSQKIASAGDGPAVRVWRYDSTRTTLQTGAAQGSFNPTAEEILTRPGKNHSLVFLNEETVAVGNTTGEIRLWNLSTRSAMNTLKGHTGTVASLATTADGQLLVSGAFDATVRIWDLSERSHTATKPDQPVTR